MKRGHGIYIDEETGEECIVQTSKQAKRAHQKSGKWYKEPTEAELRAWDREEKIQREQDKLREKRRKKKANAEHKAVQKAQVKATKSQLFREGKLTFEQMAEKRKQDQLSLHSFFTKTARSDIEAVPESTGPSEQRKTT